MRILIVSDTHGKVQRVYDIYKKLTKDSPIDLIVHCGDYADDGLEIQKHLGKRVLWVKGNCDGCFDEKEYAILETEAGSFFVCHGHMQNIGYSKQDLYYYALQEDCIGAIYGHTHRADKLPRRAPPDARSRPASTPARSAGTPGQRGRR